MIFETKYSLEDWVRYEQGQAGYGHGEVTAIIIRKNYIAYRVTGWNGELEEKLIKEARPKLSRS